MVVGATAFDPFGDGQEDDAHAGQAVDGNPTTAWSTEHYNDPLQNTKKGVGLRIELDGDATITSVTVKTNQDGWSGDIYVSSDPGSTLADWGNPQASGTELGTSKTFDRRCTREVRADLAHRPPARWATRTNSRSPMSRLRDDDDAELARRASRGDRAALETLARPSCRPHPRTVPTDHPAP